MELHLSVKSALEKIKQQEQNSDATIIESSVVSTLEKIKQQEQNKEAFFKEKRELQAAIAHLERQIKESQSHCIKYDHEIAELRKENDDLKAQLTILKIRREMLVAQLRDSTRELEDLRVQEVQAASEINQLRSNYCKAVQEVSDECDVWALLKRPAPQSAPYRPVKKPEDDDDDTSVVLVNETKLKAALERRDQALAERKRLQAEPDEGDEFIRIKNALRYSMEMTANLKNKAADNGPFETEI